MKDTANTICMHATCLVIDDMGVLLRGASGCGKSDLALRVIKMDIGRLVADDQVSLTAQENVLMARPPPRLAGLIEVRGLGLLKVAYEPSCPIKLLVNLVATADIPPLATPAFERILDVTVPALQLCAYEASAPQKLAIAVKHIGLYGFPQENGQLG